MQLFYTTRTSISLQVHDMGYDVRGTDGFFDVTGQPFRDECILYCSCVLYLH